MISQNEVVISQNDKGYWFFMLVGGSHDHRKIRVWVNNRLVENKPLKEYGDGSRLLPLPIIDGKVEKTDKGSYVIRPVDGWTVHLIEIISGYRGSATIETIEGGEVVAADLAFHSPQGNLGVTAWALVNANGPIRVVGKRTGRRIDPSDERVGYTLYPNGDKILTEEEGLEAMLV